MLVNLHKGLTDLSMFIRLSGLPEGIPPEEMREVEAVQVIIEQLIENEKYKQRMITGKP